MNASIFKAYDIRGVYGKDFDESDAYAIGRATVEVLKLKTIALGRDARISSPVLFESFARGARESGANVIDLGLLTTPMVYFASWKLNVDAAVSITASHNPPEYNGLKIAQKNALPVGEKSGLFDIRDRVIAGTFENRETRGTLSTQDIKPDYYKHFASFAKLGEKKFKVVIDCANAMGVLELPIFKMFPKNIEVVTMYDDLEHPFSTHEANPLKTETLDELRARVVSEHADLGIAFDGDADRVGFVDETGAIIPMDHMTGIIAREVLKSHPGATILYDLRSSRAVREVIEEAGGIAKECKVGHANIKQQMRDDTAVFAGELSGHYYFLENSYAEAGSLAALMILSVMSETGQSASKLARDLKRYFHSGEINSEVENKDEIIKKLEQIYSNGKISHLDGVKIDFPNWWLNVRPSNTEPLLRLNLEANTEALMIEKRDEVLGIIQKK
ncbi:MAG: phosphomannomutase/phosphoglucomutase [Candidatus Moraniibacteriota bacterium]